MSVLSVDANCKRINEMQKSNCAECTPVPVLAQRHIYLYLELLEMKVAVLHFGIWKIEKEAEGT